MSQPSTAALTLLEGWSAPDAKQGTLRDQYAAHLRARPDALSRACLPDHLTASTLVMSVDGAWVLLTLHAKAGRWFQFGGHIEAFDRDLASAALREATEESGLADLRLDPEPVHLDAHDVPFCGGPGTRHLDVRFVAVADRAGAPEVSEESADVCWWPADDLPSDEVSLEELVRLARVRLEGVTA